MALYSIKKRDFRLSFYTYKTTDLSIVLVLIKAKMMITVISGKES